MLLTLKAKLQTNADQRRKLLELMEAFNSACDHVSREAFDTKTFNKYKLQKSLYFGIRERYRLPAQFAIRAISKVVESYKTEREHLHLFKPHGAIVYDQRIMSIKGVERVRLTTLEGRIELPMLLGGYAKLDQRRIRGQADLLYIRENFYLCLVVEQPEGSPLTPEGVLGVDFGIVNLASTSDSIVYSGKNVEEAREHYTEKKAELQARGTKSSKKKLKKISGREARFKRDTNHVISKWLVQAAVGTKRAIALEDLSGIRLRSTVRRRQRDRLGKWAFKQLRLFVEYKAKLSGIPVLLVDPRHTSQRCSICGHTEKANRISQSEFRCRSCGHAENADLNAARNIQWRAEVMQPIAVCRVAPELELQANDFSRWS